jgi:pyruvate/2-oxoglutarate dehydrogenase complex dihydrolipoamide acyltransferase (E2) component
MASEEWEEERYVMVARIAEMGVTLGSWPLLVMWIGPAMGVSREVRAVLISARWALAPPWRRRPSWPASDPSPPHASAPRGEPGSARPGARDGPRVRRALRERRVVLAPGRERGPGQRPGARAEGQARPAAAAPARASGAWWRLMLAGATNAERARRPSSMRPRMAPLVAPHVTQNGQEPTESPISSARSGRVSRSISSMMGA